MHKIIINTTTGKTQLKANRWKGKHHGKDKQKDQRFKSKLKIRTLGKEEKNTLARPADHHGTSGDSKPRQSKLRGL